MCLSLTRIALTAILAIASILCSPPLNAQIFGGAGEILADTILELEDLKAQCAKSEERATFAYVQALKRLEWYRSEYYSEVEEEKVRILAAGITQKETGKPKYSGYRDIRDVSPATDVSADPYALTRSNFENIYWHRRPKPNYTEKDCRKKARKWFDDIPALERKMPSTFPEVRRYLEMTDPTEFLRISKKIGSCRKYEPEKSWVFIGPTSFEAWVSNAFSKPYGRQEHLSRPIYQQLKQELFALGAAAEAATRIPFDSLGRSECSTLETAISSYMVKHLSL